MIYSLTLRCSWWVVWRAKRNGCSQTGWVHSLSEQLNIHSFISYHFFSWYKVTVSRLGVTEKQIPGDELKYSQCQHPPFVILGPKREENVTIRKGLANRRNSPIQRQQCLPKQYPRKIYYISTNIWIFDFSNYFLMLWPLIQTDNWSQYYSQSKKTLAMLAITETFFLTLWSSKVPYPLEC